MEDKIKEISPLQLAYLGDAVYEAWLRHWVITTYDYAMDELHAKVVALVNATFQATAVRELESFLTPQEWQMVKKGRNAKSGSNPKHAKVSDYRYATGLETLIGWLAVKKETSRIDSILEKILEIAQTDEKERTEDESD